MAVANGVRGAAFAKETAAVRHEEVAVAVVVEPPLVAAAMAEDFKLMPHRVVAPNACVEFDALRFRRAGFADE